MWLIVALLLSAPGEFPHLEGGSGDALARIARLSGERQSYGDATTNAHEWTHGLNNQLTGHKFGPTGIYLTECDQYVVLPNPNGVTLKAAGSLVPQDERGTRYQLYFVQQAGDWNKTPFYIFDELSAYHAGATVAVERKLAERTWDTVAATAEFLNYGAAVIRAVRKTDPRYAELPQACEVWLFFHDRVGTLITEGRKFGANMTWAEKHRRLTMARHYPEDIAGGTERPTAVSRLLTPRG